MPDSEREVPSGIDLMYNHDPICPYCGKEVSDAWDIEFGGSEGTTVVTCYGEGCEKEFNVSRSITVLYTTSKI